MEATLLNRLKTSYNVQEQEAAEYIEELESALLIIKKLIEGDLFSSTQNILNVIDRALDGSNQ